jgi:hypothetical protein
MIHVEVVVPVNVAHAWEYYFNQVNSWWSKDYFTSPKTKRFHIETFVGGRVYEDFGEGDGLIWGEIIGADYMHSIDIKGNLLKSFGGPAISFERFSFEKDPDGTKLTYTMDLIGHYTDQSVASLKKGWEEILLTRYYNYCVEKKN